MKKIFLTGASSGIGLATARLLTGRGDEVWGTSRDLSRLPNMPRFHGVRLDLSEDSSIADSYNHALEEAASFDVVINNAGSGHFGPAELLSLDMVRVQFQTVVFAHIQLCQLAFLSMQRQGHGLIINVTSLASRLPVPFMAAYNAAKAAMASFTMTLQLEMPHSHITVVDLQPADIRTGFNDALKGGETFDARLDRVWKIVDENLRTAPAPDRVAQRIAALIDQKDPPPRITVGASFQAIVAPFLDRFLPQRLRLWGLRNYYKM